MEHLHPAVTGFPPSRAARPVADGARQRAGAEATGSVARERRRDLDLMRLFVVAGLIVFHSALVFSSQGWRIKNGDTNLGFDIFLFWGLLWGMPLLFVVSGMGAWHALGHRSGPAFVRERVLRLLVPLVVGLLVLVPPMFYLERLGTTGFDESYGRFWLRFIDPRALLHGLVPGSEWSSRTDAFDVSHLWFLEVLLMASVALLPLFLWLRRARGRRLMERFAAAVERHPLLLLAGAAVPLAAIEAPLGPSHITGGWAPVAYVIPLLLGYVLASSRRFDAVLLRVRRVALTWALVVTGGLFVWLGALDQSDIDPFHDHVAGWSALQAFAGWAWIVAILGFAVSYASRVGRTAAPGASRGMRATRLDRLSRYANRAVLPFYVLHEPVIVAAAWLIVRWEAPMLAKYLALVVVSFVVTVALYDLLVRRLAVMRFLFGVKAAAPA